MLSEKPWKVEAVMCLMLALLSCMLMGGAIASAFKGDGTAAPGTGSLAPFVISTLSFHGAIIVLVSLFVRYHQTDWATGFGISSARQTRAVLLAVGTAMLALPIAFLLGALSARIMTLFHVEPVAQKAVTTLQSAVEVGPQIYFGFMAVAAAPVAEELLFRGILYPTIKNVGYPRLALWGTSVLFGASHLNLATFIPLTFLAIALTWLYEATDNLLAPILTHSLFNTANFFWLIVTRPIA
ncbi:MAG TPA: CPBP family intramembrane glutamic endopeptidase [Verrucomicrobiae bacterium]|nr:CPBP family intramembrane glutamic endopeptidase [Verrucomicrobiae bacterium]